MVFLNISKKGVVEKCNSCKDLRDKGQNPACVDACIMRCLHFGDLDQLKQEYGPNLVSELPILSRASVTQPSLLVKAKSCSSDRNFREKEV